MTLVSLTQSHFRGASQDRSWAIEDEENAEAFIYSANLRGREFNRDFLVEITQNQIIIFELLTVVPATSRLVQNIRVFFNPDE